MALSRPLRSAALVQRGAVAKALFCALAAYLLWPALGAVHPEGFTAQVQIAAIAEHAGLLDHANLSYPLHAEYFYLSRQGVVVLLDLLMRLVSRVSDGAFRLLVTCAFGVLVVASLAVVRQRSAVGVWPAAAALLLTPGFAELPFYFNDNVVSAAFAVGSLAVLAPRPGAWRPFAAGLLFGAGAVCRPDAVLLLPVLAGFCWLDEPTSARRTRRLFILLAGAVAALAAAQAWTGASLWQALQIGREFDRLGRQARAGPLLLRVVLVEFGIPQLLLLPLGIALQWRAGPAVRARCVWVGVPLALGAIIVMRATETRQFYPLLAPFIALFGGRALEWIFGMGNGARASRLVRSGMAALVAAVWLAPPCIAYLMDGPRLPLGRLWSPVVWRQWQGAVRADRDDVERLIDRADRADLAVLTTHYNTDHYLQLSLWQRGWRPSTAQSAFPTCRGFEVWRRPGSDRLLMQIRTENPHFIENPVDYVEAIQVRQALRCSAALDGVRIEASGLFGLPVSHFFGGRMPALDSQSAAFGWHPEWSAAVERRVNHWRKLFFTPARMEPNRTAELRPDDVAALTAYLENVVSTDRATSDVPLPDYDGVMAVFRPRVAWVRYVDGRAVWSAPR